MVESSGRVGSSICRPQGTPCAPSPGGRPYLDESGGQEHHGSALGKCLSVVTTAGKASITEITTARGRKGKEKEGSQGSQASLTARAMAPTAHGTVGPGAVFCTVECCEGGIQLGQRRRYRRCRDAKRGERLAVVEAASWPCRCRVWVGSAAQHAEAAGANSRLFLVCPPTLPARKSGVGRRQGLSGPWVVGRGEGRAARRVRASPEAPSFLFPPARSSIGSQLSTSNLTSPVPCCSINLIIKQRPGTPSTRTGSGCSLSDK